MKKTNRSTRETGQAIVEFALLLPMLFLLVVNVVNFGGLFAAVVSVTHATRSAAQLTAIGPAYLGYGTANGMQTNATNAQILALLTTCPTGDLCSLRNQQNITVSVCTNNKASGTATIVSPGTCLSSVSDPEPGTSVVTTLDVSYRYCPLIPFWDFPKLGVHSTLPACTANDTSGGTVVHRIAAMRMIQ